MRAFRFLMLLLLVGSSSLHAQTKKHRARRAFVRDPHTPVMVTVQPGVRVEVVDFGGKGQPLIFLPGLGSTAHIYDEFAPRFTNNYHVYGITRRGFGMSDVPTTGYDTPRLVADIVAVMDSLRIPKAFVAGHSISGEELTMLGATRPDRVLGLLYLDAAFDHSVLMPILAKYAPPQPKITDQDRHGPAATLRERIAQETGARFPLNEIYQTEVVGADGNVVRSRPNAVPLVISAVRPVVYSAVKVPVLSIYAIPDSPRDMIGPSYDKFNAAEKLQTDSAWAGLGRWSNASMTRFKNDLPRARILEIHRANHYIFLSNAQQTENEMRAFMKGIK